MKNFKITFQIETADDVTSIVVGRIISKIEEVAYGELGKIGDFSINTSFGSLGNKPTKNVVAEPITSPSEVKPNEPVVSMAPVEPEKKKRRRRRTKKEVLEGRK